MGFIKLNGQSSKDLVDSQGIPIGLEVEHYPAFEMPERNYTVTHIPGRNGDGVFDPGDYKNVDREYEIAFGAVHPGFNYSRAAAAISKWLHGPTVPKFQVSGGLTYKGDIFAFEEDNSFDYYPDDKVITGMHTEDDIMICINPTHGVNNPEDWSPYSGTVYEKTFHANDYIRIKNRDASSSVEYVYYKALDTFTVRFWQYDPTLWVKINYPGETITYNTGDLVSHNDKIYRAIRTTTSAQWTAADWEEFSPSTRSGYLRLEDSYEPEYYRLAMYKENNSLSNLFNRGGQATLKFNCQPQRFLKSGEDFGPIIIFKPIDAFEYVTEEKTIAVNDGYGIAEPTFELYIYPVVQDGNADSVWDAGSYIDFYLPKTLGLSDYAWRISFGESMSGYFDDYYDNPTPLKVVIDAERREIVSTTRGYPKYGIQLIVNQKLGRNPYPIVPTDDSLLAMGKYTLNDPDTDYGTNDTVFEMKVKPKWWII